MRFFTNTQLEDLKDNLEHILKIIDNAKRMRETINDHKGANDTIARLNDSYTNPSEYYKFQLFDKGVEIVWSAYTWNKELEKMVRSKEWKYSICCYGFTPIENEELMRRINYTNTCFGEFDSIEDAIPHFLNCVGQLHTQYLQDIEKERKKEPKKERIYIYNNNNNNNTCGNLNEKKHLFLDIIKNYIKKRYVEK